MRVNWESATVYNTEILRQLYADASVKPAVVQNRFYQETGYDADLRSWCSDHGVIYQSFWTLTANPHILGSSTVRALSRKFNKTEAQIFFRYLNQSSIVPLTGTCSEQHMREDLDVFDFELASDDLKKMGASFYSGDNNACQGKTRAGRDWQMISCWKSAYTQGTPRQPWFTPNATLFGTARSMPPNSAHLGANRENEICNVLWTISF